jgi:hypothetical protein
MIAVCVATICVASILDFVLGADTRDCRYTWLMLRSLGGFLSASQAAFRCRKHQACMSALEVPKANYETSLARPVSLIA